ncbi:MAG: glycosyltransferase family 2 protein [Planctomycetes bacterium]|nr:glycosyltransferase family 2 protein [Planctomycetota bacterium]
MPHTTSAPLVTPSPALAGTPSVLPETSPRGTAAAATPRVSVVIPAYNEEAVLPATLHAALAQTHDNFEVIVVDNASTDRTWEVATCFTGVKVVREPRKGILFAREAGRRAATGQIIAHLDADCLPPPTWLADGVVRFAAPGVVALSGPCDFHDGSVMFRWLSLFLQKTTFTLTNLIIQHVLRNGAVLIGGNTMIRAAALEAIGGYDTTISFYGEDTDTAKRLARTGVVRFAPGFVMKTSARRFKDMGVVRVVYIYLMNFISVITRGKPYSRI